ncbi:hypothetical protein ACFY1P_05340 [Streptomyces sp. NPDC001407]|uniref:hypothetical protein n=1 Tax=Streptomyces sp. NPDC001407 TaxID=3364573 RepID=UPI0036BCF1CF
MGGGRGAAVALSSLVLVGSSLIWAPAGHAHPGGGEGGFVCTGTNEARYDPPLTFTPGTVHVQGRARYTCTIAPGRNVPADGSLDVTAPESACNALTGAGGTETVRYADGARSLIVYAGSTTARVAGVLFTTLHGRIAQGRGEGLSARRSAALLPGQLPTDCLAPGIRESNGQVQLEATGMTRPSNAP